MSCNQFGSSSVIVIVSAINFEFLFDLNYFHLESFGFICKLNSECVFELQIIVQID